MKINKKARGPREDRLYFQLLPITRYTENIIWNT